MMAGAHSQEPGLGQQAAGEQVAEGRGAEAPWATLRALERQKAERQRAAEEHEAIQGVIEMHDAEQRAVKRRAAEQRVAERQAAEQKAAEQKAAELRAGRLSMSRRLVESSNTATAVLEAEAAYNKLAYSRLPVHDLPFFQEQAQLEREQYFAEMMTAAGRGLLDAFTDLLDADGVWDDLAHGELALGEALAKVPHPFRFRMELAELLTQHIPEVLVAFGYSPPPPAAMWADLVQNSVQCLLSVGTDAVAPTGYSARARQELLFFTRRLRSLVEAAEQSLGEDRKSDGSRPNAFLYSLRTIVSAARRRAIPAALAAGASAAVTGAAAGPAGIGMAFLSGGVASLLGTATEAAATAFLAEAGQGDVPVVPALRVVRTDIEALDECVELMRRATSDTIESVRFIIWRGVFQTLQDATGCSNLVRDRLWDWSKTLLSLLDAATCPVDKAHQIVDAARSIVVKTSER